jgi:hypothetical protein
MAVDMVLHLLEPIRSTSQETLSLVQHSDTPGSYLGSDNSTTNSEISSGPDETSPLLLEDISCETCSAIDFEATQSNNCTCCAKMLGVYTFRGIPKNKVCPSCRVLSHVIRPYLDATSIPPDSQVSLWLSPYSLRERTDRASIKPEMNQPEIVEVRLCTY